MEEKAWLKGEGKEWDWADRLQVRCSDLDQGVSRQVEGEKHEKCCMYQRHRDVT